MLNHRRSFLKSALSAAALIASAEGAEGQDEGAPRSATIQGWLTDPHRKFGSVPVPAWQKTGPTTTEPAIVIQTSQTKQDILGFGAAFTDASCYLINQLPVPARARLMNDFFTASGLNFNVCRTCIGSSDYSRNVYSFDESAEPDPTLTHFSIDHDKAYILPVLREARQTNPDLFLFSSPWSPPSWMKANRSMLGGSMRTKYFASYAQYFLKFLKAYEGAGVKINAVTIQNELDTDQDGSMPACLWGQEYEIDFVKQHLGPAFQKAGQDTLIWILDHNYNLWGRAIDELEDRDVWKYVDGVAWHGYVGEPTAMSRVQEAFPDKHMYWTEGGPDYRESDYLTDWAKWAAAYTGILRNWACCIVGWNLALDEKGKPNIGPFSCGGLVTIQSSTQETSRSGQYWGFAHFSKLVKRGAKVLGSEGEGEGIAHIAFRNPDGQHVMVLTNTGKAQRCVLRLHDQTTTVEMPANSVLTLAW